jgi:hypothetical protein
MTMLDVACQQIDHTLAQSTVQHWLWGARPLPLDGFPLIGTCSIRGLTLLTGTYRDGLTCAPVLADHIATSLLDASPPEDERFRWFTPERPPIQTMTVDEAIDEAVRHQLDMTHAYGLRLPPWLDDQPLERHYRERIDRVYDHLDRAVALPPEVAITLAFPDRANDQQLAILRHSLEAE